MKKSTRRGSYNNYNDECPVGSLLQHNTASIAHVELHASRCSCE